MSNLLNDVEAHLARLQRRSIQQLLDRGLGQKVRVWDLAQDVHQKAYGGASGSKAQTFRVIEGIGTGEDFFASDGLRMGSFEEGWLWTSDPINIAAGQEVEFIGADGRDRRYRVVLSESLGHTTSIFTRHRLASTDKL